MNERYQERMRSGIEFEGEMLRIFKAYARKNGTERYFYNAAGTDLDVKLGTDMVVDGIPVDITCGMARKNHIIALPDVILTKTGEEIRFAIRTGNGRVNFQHPVVVVGLSIDPHFLSSWMEKISEGISEKIDEIMDVVADRYYEFCDGHGIDPELEIGGAM